MIDIAEFARVAVSGDMSKEAFGGRFVTKTLGKARGAIGRVFGTTAKSRINRRLASRAVASPSAAKVAPAGSSIAKRRAFIAPQREALVARRSNLQSRLTSSGRLSSKKSLRSTRDLSGASPSYNKPAVVTKTNSRLSGLDSKTQVRVQRKLDLAKQRAGVKPVADQKASLANKLRSKGDLGSKKSTMSAKEYERAATSKKNAAIKSKADAVKSKKDSALRQKDRADSAENIPMYTAGAGLAAGTALGLGGRRQRREPSRW